MRVRQGEQRSVLAMARRRHTVEYRKSLVLLRQSTLTYREGDVERREGKAK